MLELSIEARGVLDKLLPSVLLYPRWLIEELDSIQDRQILDLYHACFGWNQQEGEIDDFNNSFPNETNMDLSGT